MSDKPIVFNYQEHKKLKERIERLEVEIKNLQIRLRILEEDIKKKNE